MIALRAIGTAEISSESLTITPSQEIVFAAAIYLILERGKFTSRARLASLLWPDAAETVRAHRLRQTILQLRKLAFPIVADRVTLHLRKPDVQADIDSLETIVRERQGQGQSLEFLPGYCPSFSAAFRDWLENSRTSFQSSVVGLLVHELSQARLRGDWAGVETLAASCLVLDALNEEAVLAQAEAAAMRGSKRKAVAILDQYLSEVGDATKDLKLPATLLRRRVVERVPDRPALLNLDPAFVGRETEMATLTRVFEHAYARKGSAVLLLGEPGIGKTRLSSELARFAELRGARVQRASCRRADVDRPMSLFVDIVPQLREMPGALGCAPETFAWLRRLTDFEQRPEVFSMAADSEMLFENVRAALFDLLDSIVEEHCLVLVIEDLQWLDPASAKLLVRMVEWSEQRRILFLLNARPSDNAFLDYAEKLRLQTTSIGPLAPIPAKALLMSVALRPGDEPESGFVDWCLAVAEGNPFFLQELAHHWIETGQRYEAPPSVNKVLQERLSRLSQEALQVLQTCAVLGDYATLGRIERVLQYPSHQLLSAVEELSSAAMLRILAENTETTDQIQPRHDFVASAAIGRLSPVSVTFLHRCAADILEKELEQQTVSATVLWACATHRHRAGDRVRALELRMSCAEHLLELGLSADACAAYEQTLNFCATDSELLKARPRLARALELNGQCAQGIEVLELCTRLAATLDGSQGKHNDYELLMLNAKHRSALDFRTLLEESLACVSCDQASPKHRVGAAVLAMKLALDFGRSDHVDSIYSKVSRLFHQPDVSELNSLEIETIYRTSRGDGLVPMDDLRRLVEVAHKTEGELGYSHALLMVANACRLSGRYHEGLQFASTASRHAVVHHLHARRRQTMLSEVALHIAAGAFADARNCLRAIGDYPFRSDSPKERQEIQLIDARIAIEEGDLVRASRIFAQVEAMSPKYSLARKGYYLALAVRIRLMEGAELGVIEPLVFELEAAHMQTRSTGLVDFETYALYLGMCGIQQEDHAVRMLEAYVRQRRAKWPLPLPIVIALSQRSLEESFEAADKVGHTSQETAALSTVPLSGV